MPLLCEKDSYSGVQYVLGSLVYSFLCKLCQVFFDDPRFAITPLINLWREPPYIPERDSIHAGLH